METREQLHQRVRGEQQLKAQLRLATTRLADAEQARIWAIVATHQAGLSIRQIAAATGLSRSRIYQLLQDDEADAGDDHSADAADHRRRKSVCTATGAAVARRSDHARRDADHRRGGARCVLGTA